VADQIRLSLPTHLDGLTIWHCRSVDRWVEQRIKMNDASVFYVAAEEGEYAHGEIVGAAEFRVVESTVFLNQIGVAAGRRGQGIGGRLLAAGLRDMGAAYGLDSVALDVEPANKPAYEWYRRIGFGGGPETYWMSGALRPEAVEPAPVEGWDDARRDQQSFGFSQFGLWAAGEVHRIGRLGDELFRITTPEAWSEPAVHAALDRLDAGRRVLVIQGGLLEGTDVVRRTERIRAPLAFVLSKLPEL
jgi:GNAT superfamily N-acetyltransferase